jgi:hypothetical protein
MTTEVVQFEQPPVQGRTVRPIARGDRVTLVLVVGGLTRMTVQSGHWKDGGWGRDSLWARVRYTRAWYRDAPEALKRQCVTALIRAHAEGEDWCRGWDGPEVDALRAIEAMR